MVGESGVVTQRSVYTAFGEPVDGAQPPPAVATRYGYCGAWGYEAATGVGGYADPLAELGWLHVGERYYDPASGRFMQRDPIGIQGGHNTYAYLENEPATQADPTGLIRFLVHDEDDWHIGHEGIILQVTPNRWIRIDYGSYNVPGSGDNININFGDNVCSLLRSKDRITDARGTSLEHDLKTIQKALTKYQFKQYWLIGRNCRDVARKLFGDDPPTIPRR